MFNNAPLEHHIVSMKILSLMNKHFEITSYLEHMYNVNSILYNDYNIVRQLVNYLFKIILRYKIVVDESRYKTDR